MNAQVASCLYAWTRDLEASRDVGEKDQPSFAMVLGWMERFRSHVGRAAGREACTQFWKEQVLAKQRESWQMEQWAVAVRWYLRWLENRYETGGEPRTLEERVKLALQGRLRDGKGGSGGETAQNDKTDSGGVRRAGGAGGFKKKSTSGMR